MRISFAVTPLSLKPAPVTPTLEIVTLEFPLFVKATLSALLLPTFTLPKLRLEVLRPSNFVAATPVPLRAMARGEFGALLVRLTEPVTAPAVVGANTALNVAEPPAAMFNGVVMPVVLKPVPVVVTAVIVTVAVPPLVKLIVWELLVPVTTLPNAALDRRRCELRLSRGSTQRDRKRRAWCVADDRDAAARATRRTPAQTSR